jgi:hypothetical protein
MPKTYSHNKTRLRRVKAVAAVRPHRRKGTRGVRGHPRRLRQHRYHYRFVDTKQNLYPWGRLYQCRDCGAPVIRDERILRRPRRA